MITVAGEALIDIAVDEDGSVSVSPGGAALNVARTVARLGGETRLLGRLSDDAFGGRLRAALRADGVSLAVPEAVGLPTTLAVAVLDAGGSADYRFYLKDTSAGWLQPSDVPRPLAGPGDALILGGLGLVIEPMASTLIDALALLPRETLVLLDPNCRPAAIVDPPSYRQMIAGVCGRADIVKVSVEDLAVLHPRSSAHDAAGAVLALGPGVVLVTDGASPVHVHCAAGQRRVAVPAVRVADTVGGGDAFVAAFMLRWCSDGAGRDGLADLDLLQCAVEAAVEVSALTCMRAGADPPRVPDWLRRPQAARALLAESCEHTA